jgi:hypothetical protein
MGCPVLSPAFGEGRGVCRAPGHAESISHALRSSHSPLGLDPLLCRRIRSTMVREAYYSSAENPHPIVQRRDDKGGAASTFSLLE